MVHGRDLARATGQRPAYISDVVQAAMRFTQAGAPGARVPGAAFAPPVPAADDLPETDRLAALLGRAP